MNYSKVNWTTQTAITKESLNQMDEGIAALSSEVADMQTSVTALSSANIQRGGYKFKSTDTIIDPSWGGHYVDATINFPVKFGSTPSVFTQIASGYITQGFSVATREESTTSFTMRLSIPQGTIPADTGIYVQWLAIGS